MKLYKEFKQEQQILELERQDREQAGIQEQIVIIYEHNPTMAKIKNAVKTMAFFLLILLLGAGIAAACVAFGTRI